MTKIQFKNLYHSYRVMIRKCTYIETLAWIGFYNLFDRNIIERLIGGVK